MCIIYSCKTLDRGDNFRKTSYKVLRYKAKGNMGDYKDQILKEVTWNNKGISLELELPGLQKASLKILNS